MPQPRIGKTSNGSYELIVPNGRLILSDKRINYKGGLSEDKNAFDMIVAFARREYGKKSAKEMVEWLANPTVLDIMWPNWRVPFTEKPLPELKEGDKIWMPKHPKYGYGRVVKVKQKTADCTFPGYTRGIITCHLTLLELA